MSTLMSRKLLNRTRTEKDLPELGLSNNMGDMIGSTDEMTRHYNRRQKREREK